MPLGQAGRVGVRMNGRGALFSGWQDLFLRRAFLDRRPQWGHQPPGQAGWGGARLIPARHPLSRRQAQGFGLRGLAHMQGSSLLGFSQENLLQFRALPGREPW